MSNGNVERKGDRDMTAEDPKQRPPSGWEMIFAWCPPEDSPLLGGAAAEGSASTRHAGEQARVTRRYDRMAWLYDVYDAPMEWMGTARRRRRLLARAKGRVLEVGVGTGKNLAHYPAGVDLLGIDISENMLARANRRSERIGRPLSVEVADVTALPYPDATFDTTVATSLFCSVADPIRGLQELGRVTKPEGQILLLEHVRPRNPLLGAMADLATVVTRRIFGFRANRRTEEAVAQAGLGTVEIRREGVWREIIARPPGGAPDQGGIGT